LFMTMYTRRATAFATFRPTTTTESVSGSIFSVNDDAMRPFTSTMPASISFEASRRDP